jgi:putative transposase
VLINGFVLMDNHFHLIWQVVGNEPKFEVQRDFLKYTSQTILRSIKLNEPSLMLELCVNTGDRKYQVWERNSLSVALTNERFLLQKLNYIHNNPVRAGLCKYPEEYKYSSAGFYFCNAGDWDFLSHYKG